MQKIEFQTINQKKKTLKENQGQCNNIFFNVFTGLVCHKLSVLSLGRFLGSLIFMEAEGRNGIEGYFSAVLYS